MDAGGICNSASRKKISCKNDRLKLKLLKMRGQGSTPTIIAATKIKAAQNTRALIERVKPIWMPPEQVVSSVLLPRLRQGGLKKSLHNAPFIRRLRANFLIPKQE